MQISSDCCKPIRANVILKKRRSNECFADATFDAKSINSCLERIENCTQTTFINGLQYCCVSASFSVKKKKKKLSRILFLKEEDISLINNASENFKAIKSAIENVKEIDKIEQKLMISPIINAKEIHNQKQSLLTDITDKSELKINDTKAELINDNAGLTMNKQINSQHTLSSTISKNNANLMGKNSDENKLLITDKAELNKLKNLLPLNEHHSRHFKRFIDLATKDSSDRLIKWKNKLKNGRLYHKDLSEPPPIIRRIMPMNQSDNSNKEESGAEIMDWNCSEYKRPKMLRQSNVENSVSCGIVQKITKPRVIQPTRSVNDLYLATNQSDICKVFNDLTTMDHRTLKNNDNRGQKCVRNRSANPPNVKNTQYYYASSGKANDLPPPVRITPYSGIKPVDMDILRPVAFRPYNPNIVEMRHQSALSTASFTRKFNYVNESQNNRSASVSELKRYDLLKELSSSPSMNYRPHGIYHPSTSFSDASPEVSCKKTYQREKDDNNYDIVPEYLDRNLSHPLSSKQEQQQSSIQSNSSSNQGTNTSPRTNGYKTFSAAATQSPHNLHKHNYASNTSSGSRNSSGIHVTPSPSDSGIVDYETIIRDKENELSNMRTAMEQNEEIVIKVYLEKEKFWKDQLTEFNRKLQASQQGENALRQQIQRCNEQRDQFQKAVQNLTNDKKNLQRKCVQTERELFQLRELYNEIFKDRDASCETCRRISRYSDNKEKRVRPPIPTPRQTKESVSERELRIEVKDLREEVSTLREKLNEQIVMFSEERKCWEKERINIVNQKSTEHFQVSSDKNRHSKAILNSDKMPYVLGDDQLI